MPLFASPIDGAPMRQIHRYGIEFDVCPSSGGVWLDKGELEKLIALVKEDAPLASGHERIHRGYRDYDDDDDDHEHRRRGKRSRLSDLFDF